MRRLLPFVAALAVCLFVLLESIPEAQRAALFGLNITGGAITIASGATPATPAAGSASLYAVTSQGHTQLAYLDQDGSVVLLARDQVMLARNTTGSTIAKGAAVDFNGSTGTVPTIGLADANATQDGIPAHAEGLTLESIANNGFGLVVKSGRVSNLNTAGFVEGAQVYLSTTAGAITATPPATAGSFIQPLGVVISSHATQGAIDLNIQAADGSTIGLTSTRIPFVGANALTDDAALIWDNTAKAIAVGTTPATTGVVRVPNSADIYARNGANNGNVRLIGATASNVVSVGDNTRNLTLIEAWDVLSSNGDMRPGTNGVRSIGDATHKLLSLFTAKIHNAPQVATDTGTVTAFAPTSSVVILGNASDLTIQGIAAGEDGQLVTFVSAGAGNVYFAHQAGSASAADRLTNFVTTAITPLAATKGRATFRYRSAATTWVMVDHEQGAFLTEAFTAGDFTANGSMTWTVAAGDVGVSSYYIAGRSMTWLFRYSTTTVGGTPNTTLHKLAPLGVTVLVAFDGTFYAEDNGTKAAGWYFNNTNTGIGFAKLAGGNWTAATDTTKIAGQATIAIQ